MFSLLNEKIELFQRKCVPDQLGGIEVQWESLGKVFAQVRPCGVPYPLKKDGCKREEESAYEVIFREDKRGFNVNKVLWDKKELFLFQSPQRITEGYLMLKVFSWKKEDV